MVRSSNIFWGCVFLVLGGLFLVDSLGILDLNLWGILWPLMLMLFGVWVMVGYFRREEPLAGEEASIPLENARSASIGIHHGAGRLTIGSGAGPMDLVSGTFGGGLNTYSNWNEDHLNLTLRIRDSGFPMVVIPWFWGSQHRFDWFIHLSDEIPLDLKLKTGASDTRLNLTDLLVRDLRVDTGASQTEIHLPNGIAHTKAVVKSGVASVKIYVPEGVSARIRTKGGLMDARVNRDRFPRTGGVYQSPDYETAANKVEVFVDMGVGSVMVL